MSNILDEFVSLNNKNGFHNFFLFEDGKGFSIQKKLKEDDNTSLISFYIPESKNNLKKIHISATYGRKVEDGVQMRQGATDFFAPIDLQSSDDYFYDSVNNKLLKGRKEISPEGIVNEIYNIHIKPTRLIIGFWIRFKVWFWKVVIKNFYQFLSNFFHWSLYLINGNKYLYEPIGETERMNGKIVSSKYYPADQKEKDNDGKDIEANGFDFYGHKVSYWVIAFYSIIHIFLYILSEYYNFKPEILVKIFTNSFLLFLYAILSMLTIDVFIPNLLKVFIRFFSKSSIKCLYKKIKL
jgi:hypothetical protein